MKLQLSKKLSYVFSRFLLSIGCIVSIGMMLSMFFLFMSLNNLTGLLISISIVFLAAYTLLSRSNTVINKLNKMLFYTVSVAFLSLVIPYAVRNGFNILHAIGKIAGNFHNTQKLIRGSKYLSTQKQMALVLDYIKLKIKNVVPYTKQSPEKVASLKMHHAKFQDLIALFEEVFIGNTYAFTSDKKEPFIIDCGSNIGMTVLYFKNLYPKAKILAFEPDKQAFKTLKNNVTGNAFDDVTAINKALHVKEGTITFYKSSDPADTMNSIFPSNYLNAQKEIVPTTKLSNYINREVDLLKIDTEGAEDLIFEDLAQNNKFNFIKEIIFEYHHHIEQNVDKLSVILKTLETNGFGYLINARGSFTKQNQGKQSNMMIYAYKK